MAQQIMAPDGAIGESIWLEGPALFKVGETCINRENGDELVIEEGYGLHRAYYEGGNRVDDDGDRYSMRWGYVVRKNGKEFFCRAGDLLDLNDRPQHLQLVRPPAPAVKKTRSPTAAEARRALVDLVKACDAAQAMDVIKIVSRGAEGLERRLKDALRFGEINETQAEMARALAVRIGLASEAQMAEAHAS
ncbi:hypothetical protein [Variovorax guangxiensis]|uniref:hypothetical protein n=1 Tax=Variovorax guangxiensis TaxID=1775474 RepID=UPI002856FEEA|nr:hypothetical protein [Variovorax guangxiensis]MDR6857225.1 hypothetical protein [Variovorax guangxiensis]